MTFWRITKDCMWLYFLLLTIWKVPVVKTSFTYLASKCHQILFSDGKSDKISKFCMLWNFSPNCETLLCVFFFFYSGVIFFLMQFREVCVSVVHEFRFLCSTSDCKCLLSCSIHKFWKFKWNLYELRHFSTHKWMKLCQQKK